MPYEKGQIQPAKEKNNEMGQTRKLDPLEEN